MNNILITNNHKGNCIIPTGIIQYNCLVCGKTYKLKTHYSRHTVICDLMNKTKKDRDTENIELSEILPITQMYSLIVSMALKIEAMDKKVKHLTKLNELRIKKIDVLDWLNKTYRNNACSIDMYIKSLVVNRTHLEYLFADEHTYVDTICDILMTSSGDGEMKNTDFRNIVRSVDHNRNVLYNYSAQNIWVVLEDMELNKIIDVASKGLMLEFIKWQDENTYKTGIDSFDEVYLKNMKKITRDYVNKYSAIKTELYQKTKVDMPKF